MQCKTNGSFLLLLLFLLGYFEKFVVAQTLSRYRTEYVLIVLWAEPTGFLYGVQFADYFVFGETLLYALYLVVHLSLNFVLGCHQDLGELFGFVD